ncbi:hypothetical protein AVEN_150939-1 [Araneus ventricosus]|uniref:Uncharacterized protein n=1 Tax=Araneus ventricosus TaxID=182803 RepID=A0A4Y2X6Q6_ARAVE|nr:hypothetical protein AVEN_97532-1 [Araneus ventricosus]GBO24289.1 hypothetical protein AVEN_65606-1 [Araneus ventricosus]GBO44846.1 hypothetical protein AVEN_150939-1 [Araneus ventricosus]
MFIWNAAVEELIQFQEPFLLDGQVPRHSTLKGTRRKTENNNIRQVHRRRRERGIMGKTRMALVAPSTIKKEKTANCNRYKTVYPNLFRAMPT